MRTVSKSRFKPRAFEYFRMVEERRETLVITDRGTPVLKITPITQGDDADLAALRGSVLRYDDPLEPVDEPPSLSKDRRFSDYADVEVIW